ncbi:probable LRR receptor-like serine/threonine-protein kinase At3g47570 isoform X2 [Oryza glaberrima]|nr:probable LRR receptor-like serine/threonine-protein kinase At3g47570 isoform X2 [Oryza glaberrima]
MLSLLDFRAIANDPTGALSSWNSSIHYCSWRGVICKPKNRGRVTALNLAGYGLSGPIATSVGNLTLLHALDLSSNQFSGKIPNLNNLQKMQYLNLSSNSLDGPIPDSLTNCSNLKIIDFYSNSLQGEIPLRLDLLPNLLQLILSSNELTGVIPSILSNITGVQKLGLAHNNLQGSIPQELGNLPNLSALLLGGNKLSGEIPQSLFNLSSLQILGLELNLLGGSLPSNIGDAFPNIQQILLAGNKFEGHIPSSLGNASSLTLIEFSSNNFSGQIPSSFGKLRNLKLLNLEMNSLEANDSQSWDFVPAITNCSSLEMLILYVNKLSGYIPNSIGNLSSVLQILSFGENMISGVVPPSIGNLQSLIELSLGRNNLNGTIKEWVGKLTKLQILNLQVNSFTGTIPSSIGNLTQVTKIFFGSNEFDGPIPSTIGNLQRPTLLDLSQNNLESNIPLEITYLDELVILDLSSNKLSGAIPDGWGKFQSIQTLRMDQNFLTGNIPNSFGKLKSLSTLNLSHNILSGAIPIALTDLQYSTIDLSFNRLQGKIPADGIFENTTAVFLDGNRGLCGGATGFHMPSCPHVSGRTKRSYYLIRVLIPIFGFMSLVLLVFLFLLKKRSRKPYLSSQAFGQNFPIVSYNDLAQCTGNFSESNLIGKGSCGSVYRGKLKEPNMEVAVKVFDLEMRGAERSFMSECETLRSIQHRNLLSIVTACSTVDNTGNLFKALVYEFMPNGNLDTWLHHKQDGKGPNRLDLNRRISIAVNIADVLDYLHHDCGRPTVHCDLKPSNILLNDEMTAVLGDFGIAKFYADSGGSVSSVGVKGTIGYIAPEYARGGNVSTSGDVYGFGILLLEMIIGKRPTDPVFKDGLEIVNFVESNFPHKIFDVVDADLVEDCKEFSQAIEVTTEVENVVDHCLISLLELALCCARPSPSERPNMKQVASKMHAIETSYLAWKSKK